MCQLLFMGRFDIKRQLDIQGIRGQHASSNHTGQLAEQSERLVDHVGPVRIFSTQQLL